MGSITMKTLSASPEGVLEAGKTYRVPEQVSVARAAELLEGGFAISGTEADDAAASATGPAGPAETPPADKPLDKMTLAELQAYAADARIDLGSAVRKSDVLAAIEAELARRAEPDPGTGDGGDGGGDSNGGAG